MWGNTLPSERTVSPLYSLKHSTGKFLVWLPFWTCAFIQWFINWDKQQPGMVTDTLPNKIKAFEMGFSNISGSWETCWDFLEKNFFLRKALTNLVYLLLKATPIRFILGLLQWVTDLSVPWKYQEGHVCWSYGELLWKNLLSHFIIILLEMTN